MSSGQTLVGTVKHTQRGTQAKVEWTTSTGHQSCTLVRCQSMILIVGYDTYNGLRILIVAYGFYIGAVESHGGHSGFLQCALWIFFFFFFFFFKSSMDSYSGL